MLGWQILYVSRAARRKTGAPRLRRKAVKYPPPFARRLAAVHLAAVRLLAAVLALLPAAPLAAQGPAADWRTLETASYRFFYPAEAEDFTRHAAARLEAVRERVALEVGYRPEGRTEVMVVDPVAGANGSAWPLQGWGRMILFTTPPGPESVLGYYDDWSSLLILHEEVHLAHLLRPSRRPLEKKLGALLPLGPIGRKAPTWATEGYATYLEGRMTGFGRPYADFRPSLLRRWAQQGYLPSYGELNGSTRRYLGGSFPYLVGSAFLEWLVAREGEDSLRHLWARLSAVESRSFDDAFSGVFGEPPASLYRRFVAELTHQAMLAEEPADRRAGELWLDLSGRPSTPALAPDGASLAIVERPLGQPARLVVYSTAADAEAEKKELEKRTKLLARDPEDVPAVRRKPLPAKKLRELQAIDGGDFQNPRFFADGKALLLSRLELDEDGRLIADLYRFDVGNGELRRLTRGAGLRDADPLPGGDAAIAVRFRYGKSELVELELGSGAVKVLDAPPFPVALTQPRVSPDGSRVALVVHELGAWGLEVRPLGAPGEPRKIALPRRSLVTDPAWSADGRHLYATLGDGGRLELYRFEVESGRAERLTREPGAAYGAAPGAAETYFLALEHDGYDLRRLPAEPLPEAAGAVAAAKEESPAAALVARLPEIPPVAPLVVATLPPDEPYGGGPLELFPLLGGGSGPDGPAFELGLRAGDPVGRREALVLVSGGETRGGALQLRWRGWTWQLGADLFGLEERATARREETERRGAALSLARQWQSRALLTRAEFGAAWQETDPAAGESVEESRAYARWRADWRRDFGVWRIGAGGRLAGVYGELDPGGDFHLASGNGRFEVAFEPYLGQPSILGVELGGGRAGGGGEDGAAGARFELGGRHSSLLPAAFFAERLESPGLAANILGGDRFERVRADLELLGWPLRLFGEEVRFDRPAGRSEQIRFWGLELELDWPAQPFLRLPAGGLKAGALEILDGPLEDEIELYFSLAWRP